jgi:hypothetical protein
VSNDCARVTVLIKELLLLNRADGNHTFEPPTVKDVEERASKRKTTRQELVQVLSRRRKA